MTGRTQGSTAFRTPHSAKHTKVEEARISTSWTTAVFKLGRLVVVVGCLAIVGVLTGTANAEPNADFAVTVTLYDCSGPAGTPSSFQTEKIPVGGAMTHVVGSTDIFKRTSLTDLTAGWTFTWGPYGDIKPLITCNAVAPNGHLLLVTGFFTGS